MGTTPQDIAEWFERGVQQGATHMIVVCDTYDHEDYPVYATSDQQAVDRHYEHDQKNMQRVMEVYDLRLDKALQLAEHRAEHLPTGLIPTAAPRRPGLA